MHECTKLDISLIMRFSLLVGPCINVQWHNVASLSTTCPQTLSWAWRMAPWRLSPIRFCTWPNYWNNEHSLDLWSSSVSPVIIRAQVLITDACHYYSLPSTALEAAFYISRSSILRRSSVCHVHSPLLCRVCADVKDESLNVS